MAKILPNQPRLLTLPTPLKSSLLPLAIALGGGLLMGLAPEPFNLWPLAWVALAPLWVVGVTRPTASLSSLLLPALVWGIGYHGLALSWITGLHPLTWMGIPWLASLLITCFCWGFITLWGAAIGVVWLWGLTHLWRWATKVWPIPLAPGWRVLLGVTLWCSLESLWALGPLYWTSLAYTQSPHNLVILHLGQLSGPTLVTAAIVAVNGLLAEAWISYRHQNSPASYRSLLVLAAFGLLGLHGLGFSLYHQPLAQPPQAAVKVGLIQGNVPTRIKLSAAGITRAIEGYTQGYERLADQGVDVVLTPEGALPFFWEGFNQTHNSLYQAILEKRVPLWLGTFLHQGDRVTQSLLTVAGDGRTLSRYNKVKLVPLGEYIPFESTLGALIGRLSPLSSSMVPGRPDQEFDTPFGRVAVGICYESAFAELFRHQVAKGGQFILTASNNDPYSRAMMAQHHAQDVMRSIETDRWAVRVTNTGLSGIVDPRGHTRWLSQVNTYMLHQDTIYRRQTRTLYVQWGNWLLPLLWLATGVGGLLPWVAARLRRG